MVFVSLCVTTHHDWFSCVCFFFSGFRGVLFIFVSMREKGSGSGVGPAEGLGSRSAREFEAEFVRIKVCKRLVNRAALTNKNRDIRRGEKDGAKNRIKSISWSLTPSPVD